jgi:hypothetical protein
MTEIDYYIRTGTLETLDDDSLCYLIGFISNVNTIATLLSISKRIRLLTLSCITKLEAGTFEVLSDSFVSRFPRLTIVANEIRATKLDRLISIAKSRIKYAIFSFEQEDPNTHTIPLITAFLSIYLYHEVDDTEGNKRAITRDLSDTAFSFSYIVFPEDEELDLIDVTLYVGSGSSGKEGRVGYYIGEDAYHVADEINPIITLLGENKLLKELSIDTPISIPLRKMLETHELSVLEVFVENTPDIYLDLFMLAETFLKRSVLEELNFTSNSVFDETQRLITNVLKTTKSSSLKKLLTPILPGDIHIVIANHPNITQIHVDMSSEESISQAYSRLLAWLASQPQITEINVYGTELPSDLIPEITNISPKIVHYR